MQDHKGMDYRRELKYMRIAYRCGGDTVLTCGRNQSTADLLCAKRDLHDGRPCVSIASPYIESTIFVISLAAANNMAK